MTKEELLTGLLSDSTNINPVSFSGGFGYDDTDKKGATFADLEDLNPQPVRQRKSQFTQNLMFAKDAFDFITGVDPQAYTGKTAKVMNDYEKMMKDDDPEGKEIDYNRAKVLSQKASETDDPELKKRYGQAIKQLLPRETQGLDDLSASTFLFNQSDKLQQQLLKNAGNLAVQQAKNAGNVTTTGMKTDSNERIATARNATQLQIHELDNAVKQAIQEGKNDVALQLMDKKAELQTSLHIMDNEADYATELMKQEHADQRNTDTIEGAWNRNVADNKRAIDVAHINQEGAANVANINQAGQNQRNEANNKRAIAVAMMRPIGGAGAGGAGKGTAKEREANELIQFRMENWDEYIKQQDQDLAVIQRGIDILNENPSASGFMTDIGMGLGGFGVTSKTEDAYGELGEISREIVLNIISRLNAAGATSSVFNSESEQKRIIGEITNPATPAKARKKAMEVFKNRLQTYYERERKMTAWKAARMGMGVGTQQAQQAAKPTFVTADQVNSNRKKVEGGVEW